MKSRVFVGMGSSQGNSKNILQGAFFALQTIDPNARVSEFYKNAAWGGVAKNTFYNAVCEMHAEHSPEDFLHMLHTIEKAFGRTRHTKWDDRTLDLDILFFGDLTIQTETLQIPHAGVWDRESVQVPLRQLVDEKTLNFLRSIPIVISKK